MIFLGPIVDMSAQPMLSKDALRNLTNQIDSEQRLDADVEDVLVFTN